jgi:hypothetical protein
VSVQLLFDENLQRLAALSLTLHMAPRIIGVRVTGRFQLALTFTDG